MTFYRPVASWAAIGRWYCGHCRAAGPPGPATHRRPGPARAGAAGPFESLEATNGRTSLPGPGYATSSPEASATVDCHGHVLWTILGCGTPARPATLAVVCRHAGGPFSPTHWDKVVILTPNRVLTQIVDTLTSLECSRPRPPRLTESKRRPNFMAESILEGLYTDGFKQVVSGASPRTSPFPTWQAR